MAAGPDTWLCQSSHDRGEWDLCVMLEYIFFFVSSDSDMCSGFNRLLLSGKCYS